MAFIKERLGQYFVWLALLLCCSCQTDATVYNNPSPVSLHENHDSLAVLWSDISFTCVTFQGDTATASSCVLVGNNGFFSISDNTVSKVACPDPGCGPTCTATGCLNAGQTQTVSVTCSGSIYGNICYETALLTLTVTANAAPTFSFRNGNSINVPKSTSVETVVNTMDASDTDIGVDSGTIFYRINSGPEPSWIHGNTLFDLSSSGNIVLASSLDYEFSNVYLMEVCAYDRREYETCHTLNITVDACFQTPTCTDKTSSIADTFSLHTGHGTTNSLFTMSYPDPTDHFPSFSSTWHQLEWALQSSDLSVAQIDQYTGEITATNNISIFPAYPTKTYTMVVQVSNPSASCYNTTCTMTLTVSFTNWAPEIRSLPDTITIHEDTDVEVLINNFTVYDYNNVEQDSITCNITNISPNENNLFELRHEDEMYDLHSYNLYKLRCQEPDCGYQSKNYLCDTNIGCLNHNLTQQYVITIYCEDAYGSSDTDTFTFNVQKNERPVWRNLPNTVTLNTDNVAALDTIFSILYTDTEGERLYYNYIYTPNDGSFLGSTSGNYYNDLGNITMTIQLWERSNATFTVYINGHERRNEIDEYLTININEYCGPSPTCSSDSTSVTVEYAVGDTLFTVSSLVANPGQFTSLTYSLASDTIGYFSIHPSTGAVTTLKTLTASYPSTTYTMHAFVYAVDACTYATCPLTVTVTPVNYPLSITNLPATVTIHEDTTESLELYVITTSDDNTDDTVACEITAMTPAQPAGEAAFFYLVETLPGSDMFILMSRNEPGFTSATVQYNVAISCQDSQASTDTGIITVDIELNIGPTFTNLDSPTSVTVDPVRYVSGSLIYTVTTFDTENDVLTYTCTVANTFVPLQCSQNYIYLRRNVDIEDEDGVTYSIDMCVSDPKHADHDCGTLSVLFSSSRTYPLFSNLPDSVTLAEDTAVGTTVFTISVNDPDVGETHTYMFNDATPNTGFTQFSLNHNSGEVLLNSALNYESQTTYLLWFKVRDNYLTIHEAQILNVTITNANEAPTLIQELYSLTMGEDKEVGYELTDPQFNCTDPDAGDTLTYTISGIHQAYFSVNATTGVISLAQVYDRESGLPSHTTLQVTCTDAGSLTSTAAITIEISTVNEYAPVLTVTYPDPSDPTVIVFSNTSVIENLLTVYATDADVNNAGTMTFAIMGDGHAERYFRMDSVTTSSAVLRLDNYMNLAFDKNFTVTIKVSDGDTPEKYTGYTLTVYYYAPDPLPPTRNYVWCVLCSSNGKVLVVAFCVEALVIIGISLHCLVHFCRGKPVKVNHVRDALKILAEDKRTDSIDREPSSLSKKPNSDDRLESQIDGSDSDEDKSLNIRDRRQKHFDTILRPSFSTSRLSQTTTPTNISLHVQSPMIFRPQHVSNNRTIPEDGVTPFEPSYSPDVIQRPRQSRDPVRQLDF